VTATSEEMFRLQVKSAAVLVEAIGRVRLQMDAEAALVCLFEAQGQCVVAQRHCAKARSIAHVIEKSLESSSLEVRLRIH